jgi:hypothetical protein
VQTLLLLAQQLLLPAAVAVGELAVVVAELQPRPKALSLRQRVC